ncbi:hypothetical protein LF1_04980 [Rubripirellula obstinata]|uniref:DUF3800 domain-containing protein n=1 Tax=Rubripirellula obstinata TaxID=406547 RepID=A0A5B1CA57_9BACT|nr:hypothetical protein LF1_04980 [Rubripirellula obstinata]
MDLVKDPRKRIFYKIHYKSIACVQQAIQKLIQKNPVSDSSANRSVLRYFIDEAGDTTLFGRRSKKIVVGSDGASKFFMLGKLRVDDAPALRRDLKELRQSLLADPCL